MCASRPLLCVCMCVCHEIKWQSDDNSVKGTKHMRMQCTVLCIRRWNMNDLGTPSLFYHLLSVACSYSTKFPFLEGSKYTCLK